MVASGTAAFEQALKRLAEKKTNSPYGPLFEFDSSGNLVPHHSLTGYDF